MPGRRSRNISAEFVLRSAIAFSDSPEECRWVHRLLMDTRTAHSPSAELPCRHDCSIIIVPVHPKYSGKNLGMFGILQGSYSRKQVGIQHHVELDRGRPSCGRCDKLVRCIQSVCRFECRTMTRCVVVDYKDDHVAWLNPRGAEIGRITSKIVGLLYIVTWPKQPWDTH